MVGPNGYGKTTLLRHIATRAINIPANIDVLLCEQEVQADSTPAFEMVLKSDKKRLELLEEFEKIKSRLETEHSQSLVDKLNEVSLKNEISFLNFFISSSLEVIVYRFLLYFLCVPSGTRNEASGLSTKVSVAVVLFFFTG
ncbi:unnamed protein product [Trichobilharzia regenti]|nr:unnamed protein product [Trichobilharzia regenti]